MTVRELECPPRPRLEGLRKIHRERCELREPFLDAVRRFAHLPGTVALMSGGDHDCARYHILGVFPWLAVRAKATAVEITKQGDTRRLHRDPFEVLEQLLEQYRSLPVDDSVPLQAGLLGYLAYDLKDCLEELPRTSVDDLGLPDLYMVAPGVLLVQAKQTGEATLFVPEFHGEPAGAAQRRLGRFETLLNRPPPPQPQRPASAAFASGFSRAEYMQAVEAIRSYIAQGDVYQVNMSQRFAGDFAGDPFELYAEMYQANPAAFFAYVNAGDHQVVSTSPERFIRLQDGLVETRPIKGTRPRGASAAEDCRLREELESSSKDEAELSMIVDLLRNDIGKVCRAGSVRVAAHKRVEGYQNVYHLVSVVEGALDDDKSAIDLIRATFPGGSITGCPKIRSMEIIDELEPVRRHVYTGSIGYVSFHGSLDLSIAIRTATISGGKLVFSVGGGIVYDSDPALEYEETLHKGRTLTQALACVEAEAVQAARVDGCDRAQAVLASQQAFFASGQTRSLAFRREQLKALRRLVTEHQTVLGRALKDDLGKAESEIVTGELGLVVRESTRLLKSLGRWSRPKKVSTPLLLWPARSRIWREPYGPVLVLGPWNVPLGLALTPALGALAAGNTVVLKPSEYAPNTARALERLVNDNFAPDYFHVVTGDAKAAAALALLPFSYVFFTGGAEAGRDVYQAAAKRLCPVTLELGGKNPCIVREDANITVAARRIAFGKFGNAGQTCVAPDTVFVPTSLKAQLIEALGMAIDAFYGSDPRSSEAYGRIVNTRHFARLLGLLRGANVCKGGQADVSALYLAPTLVDGVNEDSPLGSEEIFGPILPIVGYESESRLTELLSRMPRPLALYVFTEDRRAAATWRVRHPSGALGLNDAGSHVMNPELPFGGLGTSGLGSYRADETWHTFTRPLAVLERSARVDLELCYPPYSPRALAAMRKGLDQG